MERVALCADRDSLSCPSLLGLGGEQLDAQPWLAVFDDACEARSALQGGDTVEEVWVVSNMEVDPINLAAALKRDRPARRVVLLSPDCSGSLKSRAAHAGVDSTLSSKDLPSLYVMRKAEFQHGGVEVASEGVATLVGGDLADEGSSRLGPDAAASGLVLAKVPNEQGRGLFIPVVSGSGGVGKSTLCALLAQLAQRRGLSTLVLDLDLQFGDMRELLDCPDAVTLDELVAFPQRFDQLQRTDGKPSLVAPPDHVDQAEPLLPHLPGVIDRARCSFDVVVANTGGFWTEQHIQMLEQCDKALFLVDQRPSSLRACRKALDLCTRCGIAASPFSVVVNRCSKQGLYTSIDVSCALHGVSAFELRDGGSGFEDLMAAARMEELMDSHSGFVESVQRLLEELVPGGCEVVVDVSQDKPGIAARLLRGLRRKDGQ